MKLTREEAIQKHRELWHWIFEETVKKRRAVQKCENEEVMEEVPVHFCWCCQYSLNEEFKTKIPVCENCPIEWPETCADVCEKGDPPCVKSYYGEWEDSFDWREAADLAFKIANLPEREQQ